MKGISTILGNYLLTKYGRRFKDRQQLLTWQHQKVKNFLAKTLPKSQFYRNYYQGLNLDDWQQFPTIDKRLMMANFDQLNTVGIKKIEALAVATEAEKTRNFKSTIGGYTIGLSSGTSGNRGLFVVSEKEQQIWAGTILAKALPQSLLTPQCIAFFLRANSNLYETVNRQRIQFQYFDLFASIESHIHRLNNIAPTILVAPPSMLRLLADAQLKGQLTISPIKVVSVAEVLDPVDEVYIRESFGQIVYQLYQCTEGFLGSSCEYGTLHLNEDILAIQKDYLDENAGKFMPIITDFKRTSQPIIRYRLDDILTERQTPCPCGSVLTALATVEGRKDDIFWLPNQTGERLVPVFPDFIRRAIIMVSEEIQEYIAVQKSPDLIEIYLKLPAELEALIQHQVNQSLIDLFEHSSCQIPNLCYQQYEARTEYHQKLRRVRRTFTPDVKL